MAFFISPWFLIRKPKHEPNAPVAPVPVPPNMRRAELLAAHSDDTAAQRKERWLRSLRPRIVKGASGIYWCHSMRTGPDGVRKFHRVGSGATPKAAYQAWKEW